MSRLKNTILFNNLYFKIFIFVCYIFSVLRISVYPNEKIITKIDKFENFIRMTPEFLTDDMLPAFNDYHHVVIISFWLTIYFLIEKISKLQFLNNNKVDNKIIFVSTITFFNTIWLFTSLFQQRLTFSFYKFGYCDYINNCFVQPPIILVTLTAFCLTVFLIYLKKLNFKKFFFIFLIFLTTLFNLLSITDPQTDYGGIFCCGNTNIYEFSEQLDSNYKELDVQWKSYPRDIDSRRFADFSSTTSSSIIALDNEKELDTLYGPIGVLIYGNYLKFLLFLNLEFYAAGIFLWFVLILSIFSLVRLITHFDPNFRKNTSFIFLIFTCLVLQHFISSYIIRGFLIGLFLFCIIYLIQKNNLDELIKILCIFLIFTSFPFHYGVERGNIDILMLFFISEFLIALKEKRIYRAVFIISFVSSIKLIFLPLSVIFLFKQFDNKIYKNFYLKYKYFLTTIFSTGALYMVGFYLLRKFHLIIDFFKNLIKDELMYEVGLNANNPVSYTGHYGSFDSFFKQVHEAIRVGYYSDGVDLQWGFFNLTKYNMSISFSLFFIFLFFILKNKNNFKDINKLYLIICFLILLFTVQSAIYRYVIILPAVMAVLFDKNENDKYLIFLFGYLLSITDLIYFKSYLQIVSTSSMLTFLISCSILFRLINYKKVFK